MKNILNKKKLLNTTDILILAAGSIRKKIHNLKYTYDTPALIPVNTESLAGVVIKFYLKNFPDAKIHIAVNENYENIVENYFLSYKKNIDIVTVTKTNGVVDTLRTVINKVNPKDKVIVNLVTTIPTLVPNDDEVLIDKNQSFSNQWSSIRELESKIKFNFKNPETEQFGHAFTGIFKTKIELLTKAIAKTDVGQYNDLLYVIEKLNGDHKIIYKYVEWLDCGHEINYYNARIKLISSRSFNKIEVNPIKSILKKSSYNHQTLKEEVNYINDLPKEIAIYFPRILDVDFNNPDRNEITMEYYGYPTLAEYILFWELNNGLWKNIFNALKKVLEEFQIYNAKISVKEYSKFYWEKTKNRLIDFEHQIGKSNSIFSDELTINGNRYKNIQLFKEKILNKLTGLYENSKFNIMHGDLCFNNILYDLYSGTIRLIDARGSFGDAMPGIYGDQCYDIAKISHSTIGLYDYIVNGLFSFEESNGLYKYNIFERSNQKSLIDINIDLIKHFGYKVEDITFLMSLLFISMPPLHNENIARQKTLYLHGIKLLNESLAK